MNDPSALRHPAGSLVADQLEQVAVVFERQLASDLSAVNRLCLHVEQYRGKMLRPTLVLVSGLAVTGEDDLGEPHRVVAAVVEMIHMATLVHDDVLDEAEVRRRGPTVNTRWDNDTAVMLGDYLISNAFHLCSTIGDPSINLSLGEVTNTICEGELMQLHHRDDYGLDEATYFEIVSRKTASLIGECCRLGAVLSGADDPTAAALQRYGTALGTAFQIRDDLLDLVGVQSVVGKSLGRDLEKGKLTLPLIYHVARTGQEERGTVLRMIERRDAVGLRERLLRSGAVDETQATARELVIEAKALLPMLPESSARDLLDQFADTVIDRDA